MTQDIRKAALKHGYINAGLVTGHPFELWRNRVQGTYAESFAHIYDPAKAIGWPLDEITLWVAIAPTPPISWPESCGEIGAFYMNPQVKKDRRKAWADDIEAMGYEINRGAFLPERAAAIRAGLGVHGLNGLLIAPDYGSFVYINVLAVRTAPPQDARGPEYDLSQGCGNCGACISACPTGAISENGLNTHICLRSYMNELDKLPQDAYSKMGRRIYGCDACQLACPHNANLERTQPSAEMEACMQLEELLTNPTVGGVIQNGQLTESYVKSQAALAAANTGREDLLPLVEALTGSDDANIKKMAQWAASRLR